MSTLPVLCDKLGLHLLMNSNDMSFHFKFMDVINETCNNYIDDGSGSIDVKKYSLLYLSCIGSLSGGIWTLMNFSQKITFQKNNLKNSHLSRLDALQTHF